MGINESVSLTKVYSANFLPSSKTAVLVMTVISLYAIVLLAEAWAKER